jgi:hypothetical protein
MKNPLSSHWITAKWPHHKARLGRFLPLLEGLEERLLPSSYHVINANDSGAGSLRQAILDTNASVANGADRIDFAESVHGPIDLITALPAINNDVTLIGHGDDHNVTIERSSAAGTPDFRVFTIDSGRQVSFTGLTIANGLVLNDGGGGILNEGILVLDHTLVTGNQATVDQTISPFNPGAGGIQNLGTLTLHDSAITDNTAQGPGVGGGIQDGNDTTFQANATALTVDDSIISGNADTASAGVGGLYSFGTLTVTDTIISGNKGGASGVGGLASRGPLTLGGSLISGNSTAPGRGFSAGGLFIAGNAVLISHSAILNNTSDTSANSAGGILSWSPGNVTIEDSTIVSNTGGIAGGIVTQAVPGGNIEISRSRINGNTGRHAGGVAIESKRVQPPLIQAFSWLFKRKGGLFGPLMNAGGS